MTVAVLDSDRNCAAAARRRLVEPSAGEPALCGRPPWKHGGAAGRTRSRAG